LLETIRKTFHAEKIRKIPHLHPLSSQERDQAKRSTSGWPLSATVKGRMLGE
jgi:hypothetical protein